MTNQELLNKIEYENLSQLQLDYNLFVSIKNSEFAIYRIELYKNEIILKINDGLFAGKPLSVSIFINFIKNYPNHEINVKTEKDAYSNLISAIYNMRTAMFQHRGNKYLILFP